MSDAGARILASWLGYSWGGLRDNDISDQHKDWSFDGIGFSSMQGGKPALRRIVQAILSAEKENQIPNDTQWQPIETSPRDGTDIIVCDAREYRPISLIVYYDDEDFYPYAWGTLDGPSYHIDKFTHWMPAPAPPAAPDAEATPDA